MTRLENGWEESASAWISDMGETGDFSRRHILDAPMLARIHGRGFVRALDVGAGEGRFSRMMKSAGIEAVGVEPTPSLRAVAETRDPSGLYVDAKAEELPFEDASFDLVVSYLTLIDIDGIEEAIGEMARVLKPGGSLLIANLNSFNTAGGWKTAPDGTRRFEIDDYLTERTEWVSWRGISIRNWHRPFHTYMRLLLDTGLRLVFFDEPAPSAGDPEIVERYKRSPYFHIMEWEKS